MVGVCHAQKVNPLVPMAKSASVASQTSSPKNYVLLQPIASKRKRQMNGQMNGLMSLAERTASLETVSVETMAVETAAVEPVGTSANDTRIVITPMKFKRGIFDEHKFKVYNASNETLNQATILLKAPVGSVVQQVSPKPDSVDGTNITLTISKVAPGDYTVVDVAINYPRDVFAIFDSRIISESWGDGSYSSATVVEVAKTNVAATNGLGPVTEMLQQNSREITPTQSLSSSMSSLRVPTMTVSAKTNRTVEERVAEERTVESLYSEKKTMVTPTTTTVVEEVVNESTVKSYLQGPGEVQIGEVVDYTVDIQNLSADKTGEIIVQLSIPQNLKVTLLDRDAWYDGASRKITWQIKSLEARAIETIRYKAVIKQRGPSEQMIVVGMGDSMESTASLKTIAK